MASPGGRQRFPHSGNSWVAGEHFENAWEMPGKPSWEDPMIEASHINILLDALYQALVQKIPKLRSPTVGTLSVVREIGVQGAVVFNGLLSGGIDSKLTIILEWETALKLAGKITHNPKPDSFDQVQLEALEGVIHDAMERALARLEEVSVHCEFLPLPTLTDSNVVLGTGFDSKILKIPIQTLWQPINLYLSFVVPEVVHAA